MKGFVSVFFFWLCHFSVSDRKERGMEIINVTEIYGNWEKL